MPPRRSRLSAESAVAWHNRLPWLSVCLFLTGGLLVARLFYLQVIKHDSYKAAAFAEQYKKFELPAERGSISFMDGENSVPVVLNESRYLVYADPGFIGDADKTAAALQPLLGGNVNDIKSKLKQPTRYERLAAKVDKPTADKIDALQLKGIGTQASRQRTYPQGSLGAQLLGFVNDDGDGQYGVEGFLNDQLKGTPGQLKAITDVRGVPLAGNSDNVVTQPQAGKDTTLTIDITMQRIVEDAVKASQEATKSKMAAAVVYEVNTGAVKAMAAYPSYDPAKYQQVTDQNLFKNPVVTDPMEVGSIMKPLTISAALDQKLITKDSTYPDPGYMQVDNFRITNAINFGAGNFTIFEIIKNSMNTGATYMLKLMGGGEINTAARSKWYDYMTKHYMLGQATGVEQQGEADGVIPDPIKGDGRNIQYANTTFGQGMTATLLQMAAAMAAVENGGTYYQPHLIVSQSQAGKTSTVAPKVVKSHVISQSASDDIVSLMERYAKENNREAARAGFAVGGKTGTAQIASPSGGYRTDAYNGTFSGFIGGQKPEYAILVRVDEPHISGFAGSGAARPLFTVIANGLMDTLPLTPQR